MLPAAGVTRSAGIPVLAACCAAATGALSVVRPQFGVLLAAGFVFLGLVIRQPVMAGVLAVPGLYAAQRVGPLSATDLLIAFGAVLALPALAGSHLSRLRPLTTPLAAYLVLLAPTLVMNSSLASSLEWLHRLVLVGGSLVIGAWLVAEQRTTTALRLLVGMSVGWAVLALATSAANGFAPAYPLGYHKNYVGSLLALTLLALLVLRRRIGLAASTHWLTVAVLAVGTMATQSRGAFLSVTLGGLIWVFVARGHLMVSWGPRAFGLLAAVAFGIFAAYSVQQQLVADNAMTNSVGVRQKVEAYTFEIWQTSPVVGVGIRYFRSGEYAGVVSASNNAVNSELAESGLFGATGFVLFHSAAFVVLYRRRRTDLGVAALATVSGQLLHGMVDIYWSSGVSPLPWILAGMALAEQPERVDRG